MLETAEIGQRVEKDVFDARVPDVRTALVKMQSEIRSAKTPVIIAVSGDDRPGCDDAINQLVAWCDPRYLETNAFDHPTQEELERPRFWRYWRAVPQRGRIGLFSSAWSTQAVVERLSDKLDELGWVHIIKHIRGFERAFVDDGAIVLKFWLHVPKAELHKRLKEASRHPDREWRVHPADWELFEHYERGMTVVEDMLQQTSTGGAPWHVIESTNRRYRDLKLAEILLETVNRRLPERQATQANQKSAKNAIRIQHPETANSDAIAAHESPACQIEDPHTILDTVDLSQSISRERYQRELEKYQARLARRARKAHQQGVSTVLVFEGWDAAGKGGAIRRVVAPLNAHMVRTVPIAAPTEEELAHHYLWRFWRRLPRAGNFTIFDRSWYGRVLVERVEGFATHAEWSRAYAEINDFEAQLTEHGIVLQKFWLHVSPEEQLARFREREKTSFKQYKITDEDYRNRARRPEYEAAANEMFATTSTRDAPWNLISANDKRSARIEILKIVCRALKQGAKQHKRKR